MTLNEGRGTWDLEYAPVPDERPDHRHLRAGWKDRSCEVRSYRPPLRILSPPKVPGCRPGPNAANLQPVNWRGGLVWMTAAVAATVNPGFACSSAEEAEGPDWQYTEADMRNAVAGTYVGHVVGTEEPVTLILDEAVEAPQPDVPNGGETLSSGSLPRPSLLCGSRSFIRPAGACLTGTTMALQATLQTESPLLAGELTEGSFTVWSTVLASGHVSLSSSSYALTATYSDGALTDWTVSSVGGSSAGVVLGELVLTRLP